MATLTSPFVIMKQRQGLDHLGSLPLPSDPQVKPVRSRGPSVLGGESGLAELPSISRDESNISLRSQRRRMAKQAMQLSLGARGASDVSVVSSVPPQPKVNRRKSVPLKSLEDQLKKTMPKGWNIREGFQALDKFRKIVRFIVVFMKWIMALREEAEKTGGGGSEALSGMANQNYAPAMRATDGTTFDVKDYQTKKEVLLSSEVRGVLSQHPLLRSPEMVQIAKYGLQHVQSYSEYPLHMQEKLATVAYFQEVDSKRVIIRQGHTAENFYFILSGTAIVTRLSKTDELDAQELKVEKRLIKGDSFGEIELLHHSPRTVTVVSQTPMTLLTVGRNDFFRIFMRSQTDGELPDHIKFVGSLEVMKNFPLEKLAENPDKCLLHFFKRGSLMVKDSQNSQWLYFIKSGTCQVLKDLKNVKVTKKQVPLSHRVPVDFSLSLPRLGTGAQPSKTDSGLRSRAPQKPRTPRQRMEERSITPSKNILEQDFLSKEDDALPLLKMEKHLMENPTFREEHVTMLSQLSIPMEPTTPQRTSHLNQKLSVGYTKSRLSNMTSLKHRLRKSFRAVLTSPTPIPEEKETEEGDQLKSRVHFNSQTEVAEVEDITQLLADTESTVPSLQPSVTKVTTKSSSLKKDNSRAILGKKEPPPVYVQVDLLKPRDVFGLANIKFDDFLENKSLNVSVVSRGAECVLIEKQFFIDHATQHVRHAVMTLVRPYPPEQDLQSNLETKEDWEMYRQAVLGKAQNDIFERKEVVR